jgi:alpha-ketoglutarate-dependent 2,4-dichlorophenoxyacetate dioxygenase
MALDIRQVGPCFAGTVEGIDLRQPLSSADAEAIHVGMDKYAVLVFRSQVLSQEQHLAFTETLGEIEHSIGASLRGANETRVPTTFADVSNLGKDDKPYDRKDRRRLFAIGNRLWHSDSSFKVVPAKYSLLHALAIPTKGGNTEFAYMPDAYDALDAAVKVEIEDLVCEHSQMFSRQQVGFFDFSDEEKQRFAPVRQRLVRIHPSTGRKSLFLASHAGSILGMPIPEARLLLRDLIEHATHERFVHVHQWQVGDLVIWDNRQTMHRARSFPADERRDLRRTTIVGDGPTVLQQVA